MPDFKSLKEFLDQKTREYQNREFLKTDPIQIPHQFTTKEDIEIAGFLTATLAWGNRVSILKSASKLLQAMDMQPYEFILQADDREIRSLATFVHRTFNGEDAQYFVRGLRHIYKQHQGLEAAFKTEGQEDLQLGISRFKEKFFEPIHPVRTEKHVSDPVKGSAAKRLNMFLRWMVRPASSGVDFGIWHSMDPAMLSCPLDTHSGRVARKLGLLSRKQNDAKALQELDRNLRILDPEDPVKYDFALFGLGVFEKF